MPSTPLSAPWRLLALILSLCLLVAACGGDDDDEPVDETASADPRPTSSTTTTIDPDSIGPLTGVPVDDAADLDRSALVIKIDNVEAARPQAGITSADIVFEERVEGNVTRLLAVFHSEVPDLVGPVRSTRSTDFDLVTMFGRPAYASSGGNSGVMSNFAGVDVIDVGHNQGGTGFERESGRTAPHNLMATPSALYERAGDGATVRPSPVFAYREPADALPADATPATTVGFGFGGSEISRFDWDDAEGVWLRSQRGTSHVDVAGTTLAPVNIVVIQMTYTFGNPVGISNPHGITTGEGTAMVFTDGHVISGTWSRPTAADPFDLRDAAGQPIGLTPGQTFVELVPGPESIAVG